MAYPQILIIGAGIAGLSAGVALGECGLDVTILEARNRYGGRIYTDDSLGFLCSKGASWIHGIEGNPLVNIINKLNMEISSYNRSKFATFDRHGKEIPLLKIHAFEDEFTHMLSQSKQFAENLSADISLHDALSPFITEKQLNDQQQDILRRKVSFFENYMGAGYGLLSARHWDIEESLPGGNYFINDSYQPIIDHMARACNIELNCVVKEIKVHSHGVEILTEEKQLFADAVIITVPLGVLQNNLIKFEPQLPQYKLKAINRLGMGLLNIIALKFPKVFWNEDYSGMYFSDFGLYFLNVYSFNKQPLLINYIGGERGRALEGLTDAATIAEILLCLRKHFGGTVPEPECYFITRWGQDPFSLGSYSYVPVEASSEDYKALATPIFNRIFFAGEATDCKFPATTHGAYLSGIREARHLKKIFNIIH